MQVSDAHKPWERLRELVANNDSERLEEYLATLESTETVHAIFRLNQDDQQRLLTLISPQSAAELIEEVPDTHAVELIEELSPEDAASIVSVLASDEQADLLGELDTDDAALILEHMDDASAESARELIRYPSESAGGLMKTEVLSYSATARARAVIDDLTGREEEYALYSVQYLYVVGRGRVLRGVLRLRDLVFAAPEAKLSELAVPAMTVDVMQGLDEVYGLLEEHEMSALPVIDADHRLLGVVRRQDVSDAIAAKAEADRMKSQGIIGGEELRSMPLATRATRRLSWLSLNIVLNIMAASVIAFYEDTLSAVIALAVFLPIVSDMSGCSGNQAVAVSMRELTLGIVRPIDTLRVWWQEASVGILNGIVLGILLGFAAWLWKGNIYLGLVVGFALALNTIVAVSIGGTVPLLLRAAKVDPAVASGPMLTTITDMCGFFLVLGLATLALPLLTQT